MNDIFKAYDIRGIYPEELDEDAAFSIAASLVQFLRIKREFGNSAIVLGRDARDSSESLYESAKDGLVAESADVIDLGLISTPLFYWAIGNQKAAGGIMITASHSPAEYNGFKLCRAEARSISSESGLMEIRELAKKERALKLQSPGKVFVKNLQKEYLEFVKSRFKNAKFKPLKITIDCGNGMAGPEVIELLKNYPFQAEIIFVEPDGSFPNHEANPIKEENVSTLREKVLAGKADLGIAFDGDGDRVAFLDEKGEMVRGDFITVLIGRELLKTNPGAKIFYEVRTSKIVPENISAAGGIAVLGRPGHSLIKEQMRRENILFGGELSGHYFYKDLGFIENALFTMMEMLRILSEENKPLSEIIRPLKKYFASGEINFKMADTGAVLRSVEEKFKDGQIKKIDGLTVIYPDWWFNLRQSNTEPLVRLNLEADTPELLEEKKTILSQLINAS